MTVLEEEDDDIIHYKRSSSSCSFHTTRTTGTAATTATTTSGSSSIIISSSSSSSSSSDGTCSSDDSEVEEEDAAEPTASTTTTTTTTTSSSVEDPTTTSTIMMCTHAPPTVQPTALYRMKQQQQQQQLSQRRRMIVFDKDGTLGDCRQVVRHWIQHMTLRVKPFLFIGDDDADVADAEKQLAAYYHKVGWNAATQQVQPSALIDSGTWEDNVQVLYEFLMGCCTTTTSSKTTTTLPITLETVQTWHDEIRSAMPHDPPLVKNMRGMLQECKDLGYSIAVCTSDDRGPTNAALKAWNIADLVEYSICGNEVTEGKPSAVPLQQLCQQAGGGGGVVPQNCIVVGDTTADTGMARNAGAGFCVGVLTGSGTTEQLLSAGAQLVLPDAGHLPALLKSAAFQQQEMTKVSSSSAAAAAAATTTTTTTSEKELVVQNELFLHTNSQKVGAS